MKTIAAKLPDDVLDALEMRAADERRTVSAMIRIAVTDWLTGPQATPPLAPALDLETTALPAPAAPARKAAKARSVKGPATCAICGCTRACHRADNGRCERHPTCRWMAK